MIMLLQTHHKNGLVLGAYIVYIIFLYNKSNWIVHLWTKETFYFTDFP